MADEKKLQVRRLFLEVVDLPATERVAALTRVCGGDAQLRAEIEALLRADEQVGSFLASPTGKPGSPSERAAAPTSETAGAQIGRYKLLEQIGEGGMGTIWLAEQREPVKRRVALKIIKLGMDTKQVIARFEAERQALALMDHPHIARVFDAGATEAGRPYFVMEYIRGIPILEYCDKEKVDTKARLQLFTKVCQAIQHAHQKGIIHRDIKPSNVLVTLHDGVPVPKVIDFGIAKATNTELTAKTLFTEHQQIVGTPAYMAPEQAEMSGLDIDTRSDIYSLGVLLYELLTGTTPFDMRTLLKKGFAEMMRALREDEPQKPSTRISTLGTASSQATLQRHVDARRLSSQLRGDLDWIVMKCLEKDRTRRYETANGLAADIRRHLNDEPVTAGAPSAGYRLRKFVKRNRGQVLAGSAVFAALVVGLVAFAWQAEVASDQRDRALEAQRSEAELRKLADEALAEAEAQSVRAEEQKAEAKRQAAQAMWMETEANQQAAIAEAVAKFQTDMLAAVDPKQLPQDPITGEPLKDTVTVVQAMEAAIQLLDSGSLVEQPLVEAEVRATIGETLHGLGRYEVAEQNLRKTLAIHRALLPPKHPAISASITNLAQVLQEQNKLAEAEPLFREALDRLGATLPSGHPDYAYGLSNLARLLHQQNKFAEAEELFRESLEIFRATMPEGHRNLALAYSNPARLLQDKNELAEAEILQRQALEIERAALPAGHPEIGTCANNLARMLHDQERLAEAEPLYRESLTIIREVLPADHPDVALGMCNLAAALHSKGQLAEAEALFLEARNFYQDPRFVGHPDRAVYTANFAMFLESQGKLDEAEALHRETVAILRQALPVGHVDFAAVLNNLAKHLIMRERFEEAEPFLHEAVEIYRKSFSTKHPRFATCLVTYTTVLRHQKKLAEAEPLLREALEIARAALPPDHPHVVTILSNLALLLQDQRKHAEAEGPAREVLELRRRILPVGDPQIAQSLYQLARLRSLRGRYADAEPFLREAVEILRAQLPDGQKDFGSVLMQLGVILHLLDKNAEAEPLLREALEVLRRALPAGDAILAQNLNHLAKILLAQDKSAEAEPLLREALSILRAKLPAGHAEIASCLSSLGVACWQQEKLDQSVPIFEELTRMREAALGRQHPDTLLALLNLGVNYKDAGRIDEAIPLLEEVYEASSAQSSTAWVREVLREAYIAAVDPAKPDTALRAVTFITKLIAEARAELRPSSVELAGNLAMHALTLVQLKAWSTAEPLLREALAIRSAHAPDDWRTFNTMSMLGATLIGLGRLGEAEPLLLEGYRGMKEREASLLAVRLREALERLVQLYEALGNTSEAAVWRGKLETAAK